jgi:hypothetical protein
MTLSWLIPYVLPESTARKELNSVKYLYLMFAHISLFLLVVVSCCRPICKFRKHALVRWLGLVT